MNLTPTKVIQGLFYLVFGLVPLIVYTRTSELFEFNKLIVTYTLTLLIVSVWIARMIYAKKVVFYRTPLDIPIIIFLITQLVSSLISLDPRTSFLGYYSRFHGGLISSISYSLLYWAFVSNMSKKTVLISIVSLFISATFVSIYAVLQHFGIDKHIWVQDVQERVFSTLGQPNWLAAWIAALIPISLSLSLISLIKGKASFVKAVGYQALSLLFFTTLLFTKSRSGLLGFGIGFAVFIALTILIFFKAKEKYRIKGTISIIVTLLVLLIASFVVGTPWTPSMESRQNYLTPQKQIDPAIPQIEQGGTDSGIIRKIVWMGALDIWKHYPILGTGVETFAFSYYQYRPVEHNLVSEWDFLYNKAHNEYLNFLATTGTVGFAGYLVLLFATFWQLIKPSIKYSFSKASESTISSAEKKHLLLTNAFAGGFATILVSNFFGFSVVTVATLMFLFPAFALCLTKTSRKVPESTLLSTYQKLAIGIVFVISGYIFYRIFIYWQADTYYALGRNQQNAGMVTESYKNLTYALRLSPNEAIYWDELAQVVTDTTLSAAETTTLTEKAPVLAQNALDYNSRAIKLSPENVNLLRSRSNILLKLSIIDPSYLSQAVPILEAAIKLAPTDAKLRYNLALTYIRSGDTPKGMEILEQTIDMKPNYREARYALALVLIDNGDKDAAISELKYILENIAPNDPDARRELDELGI